ncbi:MAG TPA: O-antigen ligase family protein [Solirubrobacterales bacterium]|nr:O-antigen ligase family protein [Solirubrobacterales bacterium]
MDAALSRRSAALREYARQVDWGGVWTVALCFALVVYLGLKGGGFDPLVSDQVGIAVWWIVLAGALVGAFPRRPPGPLAWAALGLLVAFGLWTALSLTWTESTEKTSADVALVATYVGVFALALLSRGPRESQRALAGVAAGIVLVGLVALLSRLHPAWFPEAAQTARFLSGGRERLSYPLDYWNGLAALIAIGLPLLLQLASCARSIASRALAAAAMPAMALTLFFTLSRGGIAAAFLALVVFLVFGSDRLPKLATLLLAGAGGAVLIGAALQRDALRHGLLDATARHQGAQLLAIVVAVCLAVGLIQAGASLALRRRARPRWTLVSRRHSLVAAVAGLLALVIVAAALDAPGRASDAWSEFKRAKGPGHGTERLGSVAGESRYQFWSVAAEENASKPLTGTGSGTFEYWWARRGDGSDTVLDAHSLYMQTLGELGIVGLVLLVAFLLTLLVGGAWSALRAERDERTRRAAALGGCAAFVLVAAFDWVWQLPVLPAALLLLAATLALGPIASARDGRAVPRLRLRLAIAVAAVAAIVAIAIPLAATSLVRRSEADARSGDLSAALGAARSARNVQPGAASPRLQEALVLELRGELAPAVAAAQAATEREPTNWRTWLVLSRLEAERGEAAAAVRAYRKARSLNPHSALFAR